MFHYVDPNEENMTKREVIKKLVKSNKTDRGLGSTVPVAESTDTLLKICEDIETQGTIVLKSVDQSLVKGSHVTQDSINRFYTLIRQGLKIVVNTTFRNIPRIDIKNLTDYRDTLSVLYTALNDSFEALNNELYGNEPLKNMTYAQYEQETGKQYVPPIALTEIDNFTKKKDKLIKEIDKLQGIEETIQTKVDLLQPQIDQRLYISRSLLQNQDEYDTAGQRRKEELINIIQGQQSTIQRLTKNIDTLENQLEELMKIRQKIPDKLVELELKIQELDETPLGKYLSKIPQLSLEERTLRKQYEKNAELVTKDYGLIMKDFNIFINTLNHGLIRNTTGVSGKLSLSQETNYRTPSQSALTKLEGSGRYEIHRRFL